MKLGLHALQMISGLFAQVYIGVVYSNVRMSQLLRTRSKRYVARMGVEPTTFALSARRSNQLS